MDAIAFWWETKDLFLHLFADGVLVPLVRRSSLHFIGQVLSVVNRLVQFLWVTDRLIVNQNLQLLEMQVVLTHEAERAARRYSLKARHVSKLLPQVLAKLFTAPVTSGKEERDHGIGSNGSSANPHSRDLRDGQYGRPPANPNKRARRFTIARTMMTPLRSLRALAQSAASKRNSSKSDTPVAAPPMSETAAAAKHYSINSAPPQLQTKQPKTSFSASFNTRKASIIGSAQRKVDSLMSYNAFDLFIARNSFDVNQDVRTFYNSLNRGMVMDKVYDFSWSQYVDYDFCLRDPTLRRFSFSPTNANTNEQGLRGFGSSFTLLGNAVKSSSSAAADKTGPGTGGSYSQAGVTHGSSPDPSGQGMETLHQTFQQLDSRARRRSDQKYRMLPAFLQGHVLRRRDLIEEVVGDDELQQEHDLEEAGDADHLSDPPSAPGSPAGYGYGAAAAAAANKRLSPIPGSPARADDHLGSSSASQSHVQSLSSGDILPSTSSSSDWHEAKQERWSAAATSSSTGGTGAIGSQDPREHRGVCGVSVGFNRDLPLDPFVDFAWMDEAYADYSAQSRSLHGRSAGKRDHRGSRATTDGRARYTGLFLPEFDEAHALYQQGTKAMSSPVSSPAQRRQPYGVFGFSPESSPIASSSSGSSPGKTELDAPEINREYLRNVDKRSETVMVQRLWRCYLLIKNAHAQYKTRKNSLNLLRHHVRNALCSISIYMYRLRAFSRQFQGSLMDYDTLLSEVQALPSVLGADGRIYPLDAGPTESEHSLLVLRQMQGSTSSQALPAGNIDAALELRRRVKEREMRDAVLLQNRLPLLVYMIHVSPLAVLNAYV